MTLTLSSHLPSCSHASMRRSSAATYRVHPLTPRLPAAQKCRSNGRENRAVAQGIVPDPRSSSSEAHTRSSAPAPPSAAPAPEPSTLPAASITPPASEPASNSTAVNHSLIPFMALVEDKKFHCTQCGKCCTGEGEIWITDKEASSIAMHLGLERSHFFDAHVKQYDKYQGFWLLKSKDGTEADNKCGIHANRPGQCSTYPWWPELMEKERWDWEKDNICEGFNHADATALDMEEAARQLHMATRQEQLRILSRQMKPESRG